MVKVSHYLYIQSQGLRYLYTQAIGRAPGASVLSHTDAVLMWSGSGLGAADPPPRTLER